MPQIPVEKSDTFDQIMNEIKEFKSKVQDIDNKLKTEERKKPRTSPQPLIEEEEIIEEEIPQKQNVGITPPEETSIFPYLLIGALIGWKLMSMFERENFQ